MSITEQILNVVGDVLIPDKAISSNLIVVNDPGQIDFIKSNTYKLILTKNIAFPLPSELTPGIEYVIILVQDGVGGRSITFDSNYFIFFKNENLNINISPNGISILKLKSDGNLFYCDVKSSYYNNHTQYSYNIDPISGKKFRFGVVSDSYVIDRELTSLGFNGLEGTDWENVGGNS